LDAEKEEEKSYKKYREVLRNAALRVSLKAGVEPDLRKAEAFAESVPSWPVFHDARSSLARLRAMGYRVYILSNVDRDLLEGTIRNSQLEVDGYVTAEDTHSYKPAPEHWKTFMRRTGADRKEILHVGQQIR
jgi:2-haloacid dehalogenase